MLIKNKFGLYQSHLFLPFTNILHGFTTKHFGDGRTIENQIRILQTIGSTGPFYFAQQIHGGTVTVLTDTDKSILSDDVDGMIAITNVLLGVRTADCVPLLFYDPKMHIHAAVHAGWKGTIANIASETVRYMQQLGSHAHDIVVCIGPHIGMCHYTVSENRAQSYITQFGSDTRIAAYFEDAWHLDIGYANFVQLKHMGILPQNIDIPITCTYCQKDDFYSYRRDTKETFGEMLAIIGTKNSI
jgi:polyphenol oxidase